jgi:hypothetical protein
LGLAVPLALVAVGLLATGLWSGFRSASASGADSLTRASTGLTVDIPVWPAAEATTDTVPAAGSPTTTGVFLHAIREPARVVIPSIGVDAELVGVGLESNGDMEVPPFGLAAWYKLGPVPGAAGPAVIVAHVDSKAGPDVFYHLKELKRGEKISVYGRDGDAATFQVDGKEQQLKTDLPVERIWKTTRLPLLRLITCGGQFDRSTGNYRSNVIVYAHLSH